jgi:YidC/Oxa1 family membrane protein insertase
MNKRSLLMVFGLSVVFYAINNWLFPSKVATAPTSVTAQNVEVKNAQASSKYYVLENEYAQLVFSLKGGSLSEINLSLESDKNKSSIVRSVGFDKQLDEQSPENQKFPLYPSYVYSPKGTLEKKESSFGGYYPLIRRNLIAKGSLPVAPHFYTAAIGYVDGRGTDINYAVKRISKNSIELEGNLDGKTIRKTFSFIPDAPYCIDLDIQVTGDSSGLYLFSGVPEVEITSGSSSPTLKYLVRKNKGHSVEKVSLPKETNTITSIVPTWVSNSNGYLGVIINPLESSKNGVSLTKIEGVEVPTRLSLIDAKYNPYPAKKYPGYLTSVPLSLIDGAAKVRVFAGPYEDDLLKNLDKTFAKTSYNPYFSKAMSLHGWFTFISEPFSKVLFWLMQLFYFITKSWGLSIILLTIALRVMLYPLNSWSIKATSKMQAISPEVQKIQERYKKDPKRAQLEVVALYKERGVNPLSGCLPLLIQLPFLIGMFDLLKSVFDLRGATFIPGWITNLTAPDVVFSWSYPIPFIGTSFHLLPVLLGVAMFYQQRMNAPKNVAMMTDQQRQQKAMGNIMTVLFTFMFYNFPSGLNLYWLSSMLLGILQQWYMNRHKHNPKIEIIK